MELFFQKVTPERVAEDIYHQIIATHETGGRMYRYKLSKAFSISFINSVVGWLIEYGLETDIEIINGYIIVEWT